MRVVDGSRGEGGGQVLRLALAMAAGRGEDVRVERIRARRSSPGLKPQHLTGVHALAALCDATVDGATPGSRTVTFRPGVPGGGSYRFDVGTAGSLTLLLQGLIPVCAAAGTRLSLDLRGGTDVKWSPPWDYLASVHAPLLARFGVDVRCRLKKRGYYPEGGGRVQVEVSGTGFRPAHLDERGDPREVLVRVHSAHLPERIPRTIARHAEEGLRDLDVPVAAAVDTAHEGPSTGCGVTCVLRTDDALLGASALGEEGVPSETVGARAAGRLVEEADGGGAVDVHQADQLVPYLALAGDGSFTVREVSSHAATAMALCEDLLGVAFTVEDDEDDGPVRVRVDG